MKTCILKNFIEWYTGENNMTSVNEESAEIMFDNGMFDDFESPNHLQEYLNANLGEEVRLEITPTPNDFEHEITFPDGKKTVVCAIDEYPKTDNRW